MYVCMYVYIYIYIYILYTHTPVINHVEDFSEGVLLGLTGEVQAVKNKMQEL